MIIALKCGHIHQKTAIFLETPLKTLRSLLVIVTTLLAFFKEKTGKNV